jgi:hypothetical protein
MLRPPTAKKSRRETERREDPVLEDAGMSGNPSNFETSGNPAVYQF